MRIKVKLLLLVILPLVLSISTITQVSSSDINAQLVDVWDISITGLTVSVLISDEISSLSSNGRNFHLVALFGNGNVWDAVMVFSINSTDTDIQYMLNNPLSGPYVWNHGSEITHYCITGSNSVQLIFLEYSLVTAGPEPVIGILALTTDLNANQFIQDFNSIISEFYDLFTPNTSSETSVSFGTSSPETTAVTSTNDDTIAAFTIPGFELSLSLIITGIIIAFRKRKH